MKRRVRRPEPRLTDEEILGQLAKQKSPLFLGRYAKDEVRERLTRASVLGRLEVLGYHRLEITTWLEEGLNRLAVNESDAAARLIDLRLTEESELPAGRHAPCWPKGPLALLVIQWVSLQHVRSRFTAERPALPGQQYPGLGVGRKLFSELAELARELGKDALVGYPQFYHNAVLYSKDFHFVDPGDQAILLALRRDLGALPLDEASRAVAEGRVRDTHRGTPFQWKPGAMAYPLSQRLELCFASPAHREEVARRFASLAFQVV